MSWQARKAAKCWIRRRQALSAGQNWSNKSSPLRGNNCGEFTYLWHLGIRESRRKGLVVAGPCNPLRTLSLVVLQHVMAQLVQKDLLQHETSQGVQRPIHQRRAN